MIGRQAAEQMQQWHIERKTGVKGFCLKTCRLAWKIPAKYPSAISAWDNTPAKNKFTDPMLAPIGATHFWKGGRFGHIAIQSHKPGYILVYRYSRQGLDRPFLLHKCKRYMGLQISWLD